MLLQLAGETLDKTRSHYLAEAGKIVQLSATPDNAHALAPAPGEIRNLKIQYNAALVLGTGRLRVGVGFDDPSGPLRQKSGLRGFLEWRQGF